MSVYFFWGDEDYLIDKELKKYRSKLDKNFAQMNYVVYDKLSFSELISVIRTQPMMFGKIMIVINTHELVKEGNKKQSLLNASLDDNQITELKSALDGVIENNNELIDIFFVEKYSKDDRVKKPDSRRKIFKTLSAYNKQEFYSIPTYKLSELSSIILNLAKDKKVKIDKSAIDELIQRKGNDIRAFDTELDKLSTYAYPDKTITKPMVEELTTSTEDLFKLTKYLIDRDKGDAILEIRRLLSTKHPLEILSPLQTMVKQWIFIKLNSKKMSYSEIGLKLGRMNEYKVKLTAEELKNTPAKYLVDLRCHLTEAEYRIKTGQSINLQEELENAIIR